MLRDASSNARPFRMRTAERAQQNHKAKLASADEKLALLGAERHRNACGYAGRTYRKNVPQVAYAVVAEAAPIPSKGSGPLFVAAAAF